MQQSEKTLAIESALEKLTSATMASAVNLEKLTGALAIAAPPSRTTAALTSPAVDQSFESLNLLLSEDKKKKRKKKKKRNANVQPDMEKTVASLEPFALQPSSESIVPATDTPTLGTPAASADLEGFKEVAFETVLSRLQSSLKPKQAATQVYNDDPPNHAFHTLKAFIKDTYEVLADHRQANTFQNDDKDVITAALNDTLNWMLENRAAASSDVEAKQRDLEDVINPLLSRRTAVGLDDVFQKLEAELEQIFQEETDERNTTDHSHFIIHSEDEDDRAPSQLNPKAAEFFPSPVSEQHVLTDLEHEIADIEHQYLFLRPDSKVEVKCPHWLRDQGFPLLAPALFGSRLAYLRMPWLEKERLTEEALDFDNEENPVPWNVWYPQHARWLGYMADSENQKLA